MEFTNEQQETHRHAFIADCRQKAWGAACNADFIGKQLDEVLAEYTKLKAEDDTLAADIKEAKGAVDSHTVDNREKRKEMQERRNGLAKVMAGMGQNMQQGQAAMTNLLRSVESNLALAKHAEAWKWEEINQSID